MTHRVTTAVATELLTTAVAKAYLRVDHTDDDTLIGALVSAARSWIEAYTGRYIGAQTITADLDRDDVRALCRGHALYLRGPMTAFTSLTLHSTANASTTVTAGLYRAETGEYPTLTQNPEAAGITSQLTTYGVRKEKAGVAVYAAGHTLADLPPAIMQAWKLHVSDLYHNRVGPTAAGGGGEASVPVRALLAPFCTEVVR